MIMTNTKPIETIRLYKPHNKQKLIHQACSMNHPAFFVTVVAGRRGGKSMAAQNQCLIWALQDKGCNIWYVCPTDTQSQNVINDIQKALNNSGLIKKINNSKGDRVIEFLNGSVINFKSAMSADSLRGSKVNYLLCDESAFFNKNIFDTILMPSMAVGGKKCLLISTPRGRNWFWEYYQKGLDKKDEKFISFKFTSYDNPTVDKKLIELFKSKIPDAIFQQEYMGEFIDAAQIFKNIHDICINREQEPSNKLKYVCGIDIGMIADDTVVTILDTSGNMIYQDAFTGLEAPELRARILKTLTKYRPVRTSIESNNQGLPLIHDLKREWHNIEDFVTTNKSKEEIVNKLVAAFSGKEITCLNNEDLITQLNSFIFELTPTGKIRYCAMSGFHDDRVMSLAIAYSLVFDKFRHSGSSHKYTHGLQPFNTKIKF